MPRKEKYAKIYWDEKQNKTADTSDKSTWWDKSKDIGNRLKNTETRSSYTNKIGHSKLT